MSERRRVPTAEQRGALYLEDEGNPIIKVSASKRRLFHLVFVIVNHLSLQPRRHLICLVLEISLLVLPLPSSAGSPRDRPRELLPEVAREQLSRTPERVDQPRRNFEPLEHRVLVASLDGRIEMGESVEGRRRFEFAFLFCGEPVLVRRFALFARLVTAPASASFRLGAVFVFLTALATDRHDCERSESQALVYGSGNGMECGTDLL